MQLREDPDGFGKCREPSLSLVESRAFEYAAEALLLTNFVSSRRSLCSYTSFREASRDKRNDTRQQAYPDRRDLGQLAYSIVSLTVSPTEP